MYDKNLEMPTYSTLWCARMAWFKVVYSATALTYVIYWYVLQSSPFPINELMKVSSKYAGRPIIINYDQMWLQLGLRLIEVDTLAVLILKPLLGSMVSAIVLSSTESGCHPYPFCVLHELTGMDLHDNKNQHKSTGRFVCELQWFRLYGGPISLPMGEPPCHPAASIGPHLCKCVSLRSCLCEYAERYRLNTENIVNRKAKSRHPWRRQVKCILQVPMAQSVAPCILSVSSTPSANRDSFPSDIAQLVHACLTAPSSPFVTGSCSARSSIAHGNSGGTLCRAVKGIVRGVFLHWSETYKTAPNS